MSLRGPSPRALLMSSFAAMLLCAAAGSSWSPGQWEPRPVSSRGRVSSASSQEGGRAQHCEAGGQTTRSELSLLRCKSVTSYCSSFTVPGSGWTFALRVRAGGAWCVGASPQAGPVACRAGLLSAPSSLSSFAASGLRRGAMGRPSSTACAASGPPAAREGASVLHGPLRVRQTFQ